MNERVKLLFKTILFTAMVHAVLALSSAEALADRLALDPNNLTTTEKNLYQLSHAVDESDPRSFINFATQFAETSESKDILLRILAQIITPPYGRWIGQWGTALSNGVFAGEISSPHSAQLSEPTIDRSALNFRTYQILLALEALAIENSLSDSNHPARQTLLETRAAHLLETLRFVIESGLPPKKIQTTQDIPKIFESLYTQALLRAYNLYLSSSDDQKIINLKRQIFSRLLKNEMNHLLRDRVRLVTRATMGEVKNENIALADPLGAIHGALKLVALIIRAEDYSTPHRMVLPGCSAISTTECYPKRTYRLINDFAKANCLDLLQP